MNLQGYSKEDVFISYASQDLVFTQELNDRLVNEGFKVWFDKKGWYQVSTCTRKLIHSREIAPSLPIPIANTVFWNVLGKSNFLTNPYE